ncbi:MAG: NAD(+)/NADH kinase [Lachnospiraceae bacterium]|nr:NAD(+)/NADH kinase [Lachnospiraceae bacterium]
MKNFFIITNKQKDKDLQVTHRVETYLKERGCTYLTQVEGAVPLKKEPRPDEQGTGNHPSGVAKSYTNPADIPANVECIMVLGGDGTLLQAANDTIRRDIPLIGVNLGTLGYLTEVEQSNLEQSLDAIISGDGKVVKRMLLEGCVMRDGVKIASAQAVNDIVLVRSGSLCILHFNIYVNDLFLKGYHADGIIISTPMGSTGYNMSAGGPIVEPKANLMVLTPICPHTFNSRSIILAPEDVVTVEIPEGHDGRPQKMEVCYDGNHKVRLITGDRIQIKQSENTLKILKLNKVSFLEILHRKMNE